ncbi:hypothetical protein RBB79_01635 [Tunturiibacter empetritectus]|nr:hypothetical protein [Edaphobacter lichenicola]
MLEEMRRRMLRLKTSGAWKLTGARRTGQRAFFGVLAAGLLMTGGTQSRAQATSSSATQPTQNTVPITNTKIALAAPATYDNKYEIYGGLNFMNFQAGQSLPNRMNLGGGEVLGTYWLPGDHWFTRAIGVGVDYRIDAGTTPVFANSGITRPTSTTGGTGINNRPLVYLNTIMAGAQYRTKYRNHYAALNFHGYGGVSHGTFDYSFKDLVVSKAEAYAATGLYSNRTKPIAALGASIDFNRSKNWAIRISPDLILEHFGTETREFFSVSGGVVYRIGKQ